ncbi:MAG: prepilin peptidase [Acidimicrobiales bacterium]
MSASSVSVIAVIPLGLMVGGIITMVTTRVPEMLPVFSPGPACPGCDCSLALGEIIPVVSWVRQRRSCTHCGERISIAYPAVELTTAALFVAAALRFDAWPVLIPHLVLFASLVAVSVTDLYLYRIPDRITFPTLGASSLLIIAVSLYYENPRLIWVAIAGALLYSGLLLALHLALPAGMGFGDVKLALILGLFLGWNSSGSILNTINLVLTSLILASLISVAGGVVLLIARKLGYDPLPDPDLELDGSEPESAMAGAINRTLPFGPSLAIGTIITILFAEQLVTGLV